MAHVPTNQHAVMATTPLTGGCLCGAIRYEIARPIVAMTLGSLHKPHDTRAGLGLSSPEPVGLEELKQAACSGIDGESARRRVIGAATHREVIERR